MDTLFVGKRIIRLDSVDSTNNYAATLIQSENVAEGTAIMAGFQTSGRGQQQQTWVSAPSENILISFVLYPEFLTGSNIFLLSKGFSVAVWNTLIPYLPGNSLQIKWPNDILANGRKIAGMLIENSFSGTRCVASVLGLGLNVNQTVFPEGVVATSLKTLTGLNHDLNAVITDLCHNLEAQYLRLRAGNYAVIEQEYLSKLYGFRRKVPALEGDNVGDVEILAVHHNGQALMQFNGRQRVFAFKEVVFSPLLG